MIDSLARDYLAIMASSVSSERAFSSAGITISKHRNCLKGDIVEALQCLKCMYNTDLIFREVVPCLELEKEMEEFEVVEQKDSMGVCEDAKIFSWDDLVVDTSDNESEVVVLN